MNAVARVWFQKEEAGRLRLIFDAPQGRWEAVFSSTDADLTPSAEAMVTASLLPAMRLGTDLEVEGPVSARFLLSLDKLGDIYHAWWPGQMRKIEVRGTLPVTSPRTEGARVGAFFTAGVDSFHTLLRHREEITDLIYVIGFGGRPESPGEEPRKQAMVSRAATLLGKSLIVVESDIRGFLSQHDLHWVKQTGGLAMLTISHLLHEQFRRMYVAATHPYSEIRPYGTSPLTEPLFSSEGLEIVHDGCEATRVEKARLLIDSDAAMQTLRVCDRASPDAPNCGRCEKCIRTIIHLLAAGGLERCSTFPQGLDASRIARRPFRIPEETGILRYHNSNLRALERTGQHPEVTRAVRRMVVRVHRRRQLRALAATFPTMLSVWRGISSALRSRPGLQHPRRAKSQAAARAASEGNASREAYDA